MRPAGSESDPWRSRGAWLPAVLILCVNVLIARKLFALEYSDQLGSIEGTFIALARQIMAHPGDLLWWQAWDCGLPFQNTYLPLLHLMVAAFGGLTGASAALAYHQVTAAVFCLGPVALFFLVRAVSGELIVSFFAALSWSVVSPSAILIPKIAADLGGVWHLRRLQILTQWGEGPATLAVALLPVAIFFLYRMQSRRTAAARTMAGIFLGLTVLANAFGATLLAMAALSLLLSVDVPRFRRNTLITAAVALVAWCWISPLFPPSVIAAIRINSPTVGGDFRFNERSLAGWAILTAGYTFLWWALRRGQVPPHVRFFALFAFFVSAVVLLADAANMYLLPQPERYNIAMDMAIPVVVAFAGAAALRRMPRRAAQAVVVVVLCVLAVLARAQLRYARGLIHARDIRQSQAGRIADWLDRNMGGRRVMVGGSYSFFFNALTDTPQLHGGHEPMLPNFLIRVAVYQIYSGEGAGGAGGEFASLWLKALGARAIVVPGPDGEETDKPFRDLSRFSGFPVLWREKSDTIYGVPVTNDSLAHVIPAAGVVRDVPINGADMGEIRSYVQAIENPATPATEWRWTSRHSGTIHGHVRPGDVVSLQTTYADGWQASGGGRKLKIRKDGLGLMVIEPDCTGDCTIEVSYGVGKELAATLAASSFVMMLSVLLIWRDVRRRA